MDESLAEAVRLRANRACEYCRMLQALYPTIPFPIDHVIARQHGGSTILSNLALSCLHCNSFKGTDLSGLDPFTRKLTPLFNPRRHKWVRHFRWDGPVLRGLTPTGRVTIAVMRINEPFRVAIRAELIEAGVFPPST